MVLVVRLAFHLGLGLVAGTAVTGCGGSASGQSPLTGAGGAAGAAGMVPDAAASGGAGGDTTADAGAGGRRDAGGATDGGGDAGGAGGALSCSDLFAPVLQTYSIEISPSDWTALQAEFLYGGSLLGDTFVAYQPMYYPVVFHFGNDVAAKAYIRLKGDSSWREAVALFGSAGKMQFVVAFDHVDDDATFHGIGKLSLDMPGADLTFLHDRIGNTWMRSLGIAALCGTSARLEINGNYYGLYVAEERMGHRLMKAFFPSTPDNDLFKGGWIAETNENNPSWTKLRTFWDATTPAALAAIVDLPQSFLTWAAEALLNDGDGYWGGDHNFYLYDQGAKGYVFLPNDLDSILDYVGHFNDDPITWWSLRPGPQFVGDHYLVAMNDSALRAQYVTALAHQLSRFDVSTIQSWIDTWSAQIRDAVAADPHRPASTSVADFDRAVALARQGVRDRADFVKSWLACQQGGGGDDRDGDGFIWCQDCRDDQAAIHPGAREICGNDTDDNCNGQYDEGCQPTSTGGTGGTTGATGATDAGATGTDAGGGG